MKLSFASRSTLARELLKEIQHRNKYPHIAPVSTAWTLGELLHDLGGLAGVW